MLIPDARRSLFGGLIDHATMLDASPPELSDAVAGYRELRHDRGGWMVGRFVIPASRLEELAGLLVRTMDAGELPWSLAVVFDGDPAGDAATAASLHALLDPAAPIDIVHVTAAMDDLDAVEKAVVAAGAVHQEAFSVVRLSVEDVPPDIDTIVRLRRRLLRPIGIALTAEDAAPKVAPLDAHLHSVVGSELPLTFEAGEVPAVTDVTTGRVGALNLLTAVGLHDEADSAEILTCADPSAFTIGFGGLRWDGHGGRFSSRGPLLSIASRNPGATIDALLAAGLDA